MNVWSNFSLNDIFLVTVITERGLRNVDCPFMCLFIWNSCPINWLVRLFIFVWCQANIKNGMFYNISFWESILMTQVGKESVLMTQDWLKRALNRPKLDYVLTFAVFVENYLIDFAEMLKNERISFWLIDWCSWFYDWFLHKERSQYR